MGAVFHSLVGLREQVLSKFCKLPHLGVRGKCSKNDHQVAVDISGLGERLQDKSGTTTEVRDDEEGSWAEKVN